MTRVIKFNDISALSVNRELAKTLVRMGKDHD